MTVQCVLAHGYTDNAGIEHRAAEVASAFDCAEDVILDADGLTRDVLWQRILGRCVRRLGALSPVPDQAMQELPIGEVQQLLRAIRVATFGGRAEATVRCPSCDHRVDINFDYADLPAPEGGWPAAELTQYLKHQELTVTVRLPTAKELVQGSKSGDENQAVDEIVRRCVIAIEHHSKSLCWAELDQVSRDAIADLVGSAAAVLQVVLAITCVECSSRFAAPFDVEGQLLHEIVGMRRALVSEVHLLASSYHWSESDILTMPRPRRLEYLQRIAGTAWSDVD